MSAPILEARNITKRFGGLTANENVSLALHAPVGHVVSVIGPNGAGKSTFFKMLSGFVKPSSGQILLHGQDITGMSPHRIARLGLVRTFQETTIFPDLTAMEHVSLAHQLHREASDLEVIFGLPRAGATRSAWERTPAKSLNSWSSVPWQIPKLATCHKACCGCWAWPWAWLPDRKCCCWTSPMRG